MKILDYLDRQAQLLGKISARFKNVRVFDFNYMPEEPLMRPEAKPLIDACLRYLATGIANHLFIFGSRGSGKTLMMRYIACHLAERHGARVLYANCRQQNTSFKIFAHLLGVRPRGVSLDELWHRFCDAHPQPLILVLDEVDLLSDKDTHKDILYLLGRSEHNPMAVLLSNHPKFLSRLDESVRSSLQPELLHFRNYDAKEILQILEDRARTGLADPRGISLGEIAALTGRFTNSDVRVAIKTLYYAALEPTKALRELFDRARRDVVADLLADLNDRALLMLRATADAREPFVKTVYDRYRRLSTEQHEEPFSYVHFYANLSYLQSIGLIMLVSTKIGRTYTNRIQLLFDTELLDRIWEVRFSR